FDPCNVTRPVVDDLHRPVAGDDDVAGLEILMEDLPTMKRDKTSTDLSYQGDNFGAITHRLARSLGDPRLQSLSRNVFGEIVQARALRRMRNGFKQMPALDPCPDPMPRDDSLIARRILRVGDPRRLHDAFLCGWQLRHQT